MKSRTFNVQVTACKISTARQNAKNTYTIMRTAKASGDIRHAITNQSCSGKSTKCKISEITDAVAFPCTAELISNSSFFMSEINEVDLLNRPFCSNDTQFILL